MISVIVPVYNEEKAIVGFLRELSKALEGFVYNEIIVVNDGSSDRTLELIKSNPIRNLKIINHDKNFGYGKSIFDGILVAQYDCIAIIDGDGSYSPGKIKDLYAYYPQYDMVVGARRGGEYKKGIVRISMRMIFEYMVKCITGQSVPDVNSGFRIFFKNVAMKFQDLLCLGFSFTTSLTLVLLLNQYRVKFIPIDYLKRKGESKVVYFRDALRTGQMIVKIMFYFLFVPVRVKQLRR